MPKHSRGYARVDRVKEQILRELAELIRTGLKDPRAASFITLNEVEVTRDYSHAKVFYTIFDEDKREVTQEALEHAAGYLRSELAKRLTVFNTPQLHFVYDESIERGLHISNLIDQVASDDQAAAQEADDASDVDKDQA
ncbi:30S ribosome-binding factor RbfA [Neisseriaceae bacterium CLB008]|nr:30S ribosome-binding factor RbfA [Neisseriaceae bacterium]